MRTKGPVDTAALREKAVALLTKRLLSAGQLRDKLISWGGTEQQAEEVVAWTQDIGLVNDGEYAKALARHYQSRGYGLYKIKDELYRRQVPRAHWEEALAELEDPGERIHRFLAARLEDPTDRKQLKKASDALVRRGFSWSQISEAMERYRRDWSEEEGETP